VQRVLEDIYYKGNSYYGSILSAKGFREMPIDDKIYYDEEKATFKYIELD